VILYLASILNIKKSSSLTLGDVWLSKLVAFKAQNLNMLLALCIFLQLLSHLLYILMDKTVIHSF